MKLISLWVREHAPAQILRLKRRLALRWTGSELGRRFPGTRGALPPVLRPRQSALISPASWDHLVEFSRQRSGASKPLQEGTQLRAFLTLSTGGASECWGLCPLLGTASL